MKVRMNLAVPSSDMTSLKKSDTVMLLYLK